MSAVENWAVRQLSGTDARLSNLTAVDASCRGGVVAVLTPRRMIEVDDTVAVVRDDGVVEDD